MNPMASGQYTSVGTLYVDGASCSGALMLGVERDLLARRRERPSDLHPPLLAEHKTHLAGRAKAVGMVGPIGGTRTRLADRAQQVLMKEAILAAHLG